MASKEEMKRIIDQAAEAEGVDPVLMKAIAQVESRFDPNAVSPTGATGLFQFTRGTARDYGLRNRSDPVANAVAAAKLLKSNARALGLTPTVDNAAQLYMAHQQGVGGVRAMMANPSNKAENSLGRNATVNAMGGLTNKQGFDLFAKKIATAVTQNGGTMNGTPMSPALNPAAPQSQASAVGGYNNDMVQAAQKIANNNLAAVNNFGWNPTVDNSVAQNFGKAVQTNTQGAINLANQNTEYLKAFTNPSKETYLGRVGDKVGAMFKVTGNALLDEYYQRAQAEQSVTGKAMADQVNNMKSALAGTVTDPAVYDKAAGNLTTQQQAENQTFNALTNASLGQQQVDVARDTNKLREAEIGLKAAGGNAAITDASLINAAKVMGVELPAGMKIQDIKQTLGANFETAQAIAANNGKLGNDPYTAVKLAQMPGISIEVKQAAQPHINFQNAIEQDAIQRGILKPPAVNAAMSKEQQAAAGAEYESQKQVVIANAYKDAANGVGGLSGLPGNPYSALGSVKTLASGLPVPKGIEPAEVGKLSAADFITKATTGGSSALEIANFYKGLSNNAGKDVKFDLFSAPAPKGNFLVSIKGIDGNVDLATPAGVERVKALISSGNVQKRMQSSFGKFLAAGADFLPSTGVSAVLGQAAGAPVQGNIVETFFGSPIVDLQPPK